ncbi:MAG: DUF1365 domain-containing protein [Pseudomonadota bacterium]
MDTLADLAPAATGESAPKPVVEPGLYVGEVMHARLTKPETKFTYRVFSLLLDLDRIDETCAQTSLLSRNRWNLVSFHDKDHGPRDGGNLRAHCDALFAEAGAPRPATIRLLCFPRVLGYVFNPLSIYYAFDEAGSLTGLIYEVRNTFGEMHSYVAPIEPEHWHDTLVKQERNKIFFVSPFLHMDMRYHFTVKTPGEKLRFKIFETDADGPVLLATHHAAWQHLTTPRLLSALVTQQFNALKVISGIHWEAGKLWLRGARYHRRGTPPPPASFADNPR